MFLVAGLLLPGCGGDDEDGAATTTTTEAERERPRFDGPADAEFCELSVYLMLPPGADTPHELRDFYGRLDEVGDRFVEKAPAEIADEAKRFVDGSANLRAALEEVQFDASMLKPDEAAPLRDPEFTRAGSIMSAFNREACGDSAATATETTLVAGPPSVEVGDQ